MTTVDVPARALYCKGVLLAAGQPSIESTRNTAAPATDGTNNGEKTTAKRLTVKKCYCEGRHVLKADAVQ